MISRIERELHLGNLIFWHRDTDQSLVIKIDDLEDYDVVHGIIIKWIIDQNKLARHRATKKAYEKANLHFDEPEPKTTYNLEDRLEKSKTLAKELLK